VGCLSVHGFLSATGTEKAVDRLRSTAFLLALATEGDVMEPSVLEQAMQALYVSDEQILQLLRLRHHLALQLAQATTAQGQLLTVEERVSAVLSRIARRNPGPLDNQRLASIFEMVVRVTEPFSSGLSARNGAAKKG
jgi:chorismate mutase